MKIFAKSIIIIGLGFGFTMCQTKPTEENLRLSEKDSKLVLNESEGSENNGDTNETFLMTEIDTNEIKDIALRKRNEIYERELGSELNGLNQKGYIIPKENECNDRASHNSRTCEVYPVSDWFNSRIHTLNKHAPQMDSTFKFKDTLDMSHVERIESFYLYDTSKYRNKPRAHVLKYSFRNNTFLDQFKKNLSSLTPYDKHYFRKEPWTHVVKGDNIYIILPSGPKCLKTLDDIIEELKNGE